MLNINICTKQSLHNEWMAFACWYSVNRNLPTSKVSVTFPRSPSHYQFNWLSKCHIPWRKGDCKFDLVLEDYTMIIEDENGTLKTPEGTHTIFDFRKCGNFDLNDWMKEKRSPFMEEWKANTVSEQKIFKLWKDMAYTFKFFSPV